MRATTPSRNCRDRPGTKLHRDAAVARRPALDQLDQNPVTGVDELDGLLGQSLEGVHPGSQPASGRLTAVGPGVGHLGSGDKLELVGELGVGAEVSPRELVEARSQRVNDFPRHAR